MATTAWPMLINASPDTSVESQRMETLKQARAQVYALVHELYAYDQHHEKGNRIKMLIRVLRIPDQPGCSVEDLKLKDNANGQLYLEAMDAVTGDVLSICRSLDIPLLALTQLFIIELRARKLIQPPPLA